VEVIPDVGIEILIDDDDMSTDTLLPTTRTASIGTASIRTAAPTAKGWHADPFGQHKLRFHDGRGWTEHATHHGPVPCRGCHR